MRCGIFLRLAAALPACLSAGCTGDNGLPLAADYAAAPTASGTRLVARLVHITDTHLVDTLSPARFAGADPLIRSAWRPQEAYSTQVLDGIVRAINRQHASGRRIDFVVHTGDACDNAQLNELRWLVAVLDGERVMPLSGPDDRPVGARPVPTLDPYQPFDAQGLWRAGVHGDAPSIDWYIVRGNHDAYALGVFPIVEGTGGVRWAPLPLEQRPGFVAPVRLDPESWLAYGNVTPAAPGPPPALTFPRLVAPSRQRRYLDAADYKAVLGASTSTPRGHGFSATGPAATWYSVSPAPGVRLIGLDTTTAVNVAPASVHSEGALTRAQLDFLSAELAAAASRAELVIVATHHPSASLSPLWGSEVSPEELRAVLRACPNTVLHLCGHTHRHHVSDQGGYLEIETASTLDWPQEARLIELWQDDATGEVIVAYEVFSHLDEPPDSPGADPLRELRKVAYELARQDAATATRRKYHSAGPDDRYGTLSDRTDVVRLRRRGMPSTGPS